VPIEAGVDTLKVAAGLLDDRSFERMRAAPYGLRAAGGGAYTVTRGGEAVWLDEAARVLWYPNAGLLAVEGHPGGCDGVLASPDAVPAYTAGLADRLAADGICWRGPVGVTRCDGTVTQAFDRAGDGLAVLSALAALEPTGRLKPATFGRPLETVYVVTPRGSKRGRWYDAGIRHGTAARGRRIRGEDQRRYDRHARRPLAESIDTENVRQAFRSRFVTLSKATKGVTVATLPVIIDKVAERVSAESMTIAEGEQALAYAVFVRAGHAGLYAARTAERRRALLREHGLALLDGDLAPVEVDVSAVLEAALDRGVWGVG
jgi:hypothetical protein